MRVRHGNRNRHGFSPMSGTHPGLTSEQIRAFQAHGFVVLESLFAAAEIKALRSEANKVLELLVNSSLANQRKSGRLDIRELPEGGHVVRKVQPLVDLSLAFTRVAQDSRLVAPVCELLGGQAELMEDKLAYKQHVPPVMAGLDLPRADDRFLRHNDWAYHRAQGYGPSIINAAVCVDDCPRESGPLHVWPGTQLQHIEHEPVGQSYEVPLSRLSAPEGIDVLAGAGSVIFFHAVLVHCSQPNASGRPRRMAIFSYRRCDDPVYCDARNGPTRLRESPYEWRYARLKSSGDFHDLFIADVD